MWFESARFLASGFNTTLLDEFYATAFRRKLYTRLEQLQADVDVWVDAYNREGTHCGKHCLGTTPLQTFLDSNALAIAKQLDRTMPTASTPA